MTTRNTLHCNQSNAYSMPTKCRYYYYYYYSITTATTATKDPRQISYRNRVIAHFVPNFAAMAMGVSWM